MKKLLHVIDFLGIGGAEKLVVSVINGLEGAYEQHLVVLSEPAPLLKEIPSSCKTTVLNFRSYRDLWTTRGFLRRYIMTHHIDIVHSQLYWSNIITRLATPRKVKVFNSIQAISSEASYKISRLSLYLEKLTYKKKHHIIGVSREVLKDFDKWVGLKGPSSVLYNMIDEKFFVLQPKTNFTPGGLRMVAVGNLRWQKNYPYLLEAFKLMPAGISVNIYGEGDLRQVLQQTINTHQLPVRLLGHHQQLEKILPEYDVFVMCSLYEGFSLGLMEAMACGLPPVLTNVPVLKEAAGEHAIYVDIHDPADLSRKMAYYLGHKEELATIASGAHQQALAMAKKENHLQKLISLYEAADLVRTI